MTKLLLPKKAGFILAIFTLISVLSYAQTGQYHYNDAWGKTGLQVKQQRSANTLLTHSIRDFAIADKAINGESVHEIVLPTQILPNNSGAPNLPGNGYLLAIPNGATAKVKIVNSREEIIENVTMEPAPEIPWDTDTAPIRYTKNQEIYTTNAYYPKNPVIASETMMLRGVNVVRIGITPYQYNPITKQLKVLRDLEIQVTLEGGDGTYGTERLRNRWWDPILKNSIVNNQVLPKIDYSQIKSKTNRDEEFEYLIISPDDAEFVSWADSIRRFRNKQGIHTGVVTMSEINAVDATALESYINSIYNNWATPPAAVLLLGDFGTDMDNTIISPIWNNYCASDNILADVDGDALPDIVFARITAQNADQLEVMVNKFINYETNPPVSADFYDHPITALGWQTERWFQICSETVGGFWKNELGKHPVRINEVYDGNPSVDPWSYATNTSSVMEYFGPNGLGYITATPNELGDWYGGNANDVNNAINQGSFMLQHRDHGYEGGWGEPGYNSGSINELTNTDLTFVFSINCLTGKYNAGSQVFTEKFHRYTYNGQASGALGLIAASEVSYSFVNDAYVWGLYDYLWPEFMPDYGGDFPETRATLPAFANVYGKIFLDYTGWPYNTSNKEVTYNLFHHHGDAFLNVYTEVPQELAITHTEVILSGLPTFEITADIGSLICLSADGEILAVADATGEPQNMEVPYIEPGTRVDLVVTKQNYFRHQEELLCVPPNGPYLLNTAQSILTLSGDDYICYGDSGNMTITMKNVGTELADNVTLTIICADPFAQLTDDNEAYGNIAADETVVVPDGFTFSITDNVPDQHKELFTITATSGGNSWESEMELTLNAPVVRQQEFLLTEVTGNSNGIVDAGETYQIQFNIKNEGHAATQNMLSTLVTPSEYTQIKPEEYITDALPVDSTIINTYTFEVDGNTPMGHEIVLINHNNSGAYGCTDTVFVKVGVAVEDWETGELSKFEWLNDAANPWSIDNQVKYEDNFSLRSADIQESQVSVLTLGYEINTADSVSFMRKIATLEDHGELIFLIDNQEKGRWSGNLDWSRVSYPINAGKHTLIWMFIKYSPSNEMEDCAWIDLITLPQIPTTTCWAGFDMEICETNEVQLEGMATNYQTLVWSTEGTGVFNDNHMINPIYTPSVEDINQGLFTVMLTAENQDGSLATDTQTFHIQYAPQPAAILFEQDTVSTVVTPTSTIEGEVSTYATSYLWTLSPETAGTIQANGQSANIEWNLTYSGEVIIGYQGINACSGGILTEKTIIITNATAIEETSDITNLNIYPNPNHGSFYVEMELLNKHQLHLMLLDETGRLVWTESIANTQSLKMNCHPHQLVPGVYQLVISTETHRLVKKVVVQ